MKVIHMLAIGVFSGLASAVLLPKGARVIHQQFAPPQGAGDDGTEQGAGVAFVLPPSQHDAVGVMQVAVLSYAEGQTDRPTEISLPRLSIRNMGHRVAIQPTLMFADAVSGLATGAHVLLDTPQSMGAGQVGVAGGCTLHLAPPDSRGRRLLNDIATRRADCAIEISWLTDALGQGGHTVLYGKRQPKSALRKQAILLA